MIDIFSGNIVQKVIALILTSIGALFFAQTDTGITEASYSAQGEARLTRSIEVSDFSKKIPVQEKSNIQSVEQAMEARNKNIAKESELENATHEATALVFNDTREGDMYEVIAVVDGDTIKVAMGGGSETLRIIGINTPETVDPRRSVQCFGKEASNHAKEQLLGKRVVLTADHTQQDRDKYGRLLRYVAIDGVDYGEEMIREGYAYEYTYNVPYLHQVEYKDAQSFARSEGKGLWNSDTCGGEEKVGARTTSVENAYYTSSSARATSYYPASCDVWKSLSKANLRTFGSLEELLSVYPGRTLSKQCR